MEIEGLTTALLVNIGRHDKRDSMSTWSTDPACLAWFGVGDCATNQKLELTATGSRTGGTDPIPNCHHSSQNKSRPLPLQLSWAGRPSAPALESSASLDKTWLQPKIALWMTDELYNIAKVSVWWTYDKYHVIMRWHIRKMNVLTNKRSCIWQVLCREGFIFLPCNN